MRTKAKPTTATDTVELRPHHQENPPPSPSISSSTAPLPLERSGTSNGGGGGGGVGDRGAHELHRTPTFPDREAVAPAIVLTNVVSIEDVPPDGGYGWVCTACVMTMNANTWGVNAVCFLPRRLGVCGTVSEAFMGAT